MASSIRQLRDKLCRELAQSEQSAASHCQREAKRYGDLSPGQAMHAIASHALAIRPRLAGLLDVDQPLGARIGRGVGEALSLLRHVAIDRIVDAERSYRATLLGVRHGLDVARLLREVLAEQGDTRNLTPCEQMLEQRARLVVQAEEVLRWYAQNPDVALHSPTAVPTQPRLP